MDQHRDCVSRGECAPRHRARKDRKRWCGGHEGRAHLYEWRWHEQLPNAYVRGEGLRARGGQTKVCIVCGRHEAHRACCRLCGRVWPAGMVPRRISWTHRGVARTSTHYIYRDCECGARSDQKVQRTDTR